MFSSFFPSPRYFFVSSSAWIVTLIIVWYTLGESIGTFLGFNLKESQTVIGLGHFITPEFLWFDAYFLFGAGSIYLFWNFKTKHTWSN